MIYPEFDTSRYIDDSFISIFKEENPDVRFVVIPELTDYAIGTNGQLYSIKRDKFLKQSTCAGNHGYSRLRIYYDGRYRNYRVHRLVAEAFLENPHDLAEVDHINRHRHDNRVENLRWVSHAQNMKNLGPRRKKGKYAEETDEKECFHKLG